MTDLAAPSAGTRVVQGDWWDYVPSFFGGNWGAAPTQQPPAQDTSALATMPPVVTAPTISESDRAAVADWDTALQDLTQHNTLISGKHGPPDGKGLVAARKNLAPTVKAALRGTAPPGGMAQLRKDVADLRRRYVAAVRLATAQAAQVTVDAQAEALREQQREKEAADLVALEKRVHRLAGTSYLALTSRFTLTQMEPLLGIVSGGTLQALVTRFPPAALEVLVPGETDGGTRLKQLLPHVEDGDHVTALLVGTVTPAQLKALLETTGSTALHDAYLQIPHGDVLVRLRAGATDQAAFVQDVADAARGDAANLLAGAQEATTPGAFGTALDAELVAAGLVGFNGVRIHSMSETAISGDGDENEQAAVTAALAALDAGNENVVGTVERRVPHGNYAGHLPGARNVVPYQEYAIAPRTGIGWPGRRRFVKDTASGRLYYSWNHYGELGATPAFVRVR